MTGNIMDNIDEELDKLDWDFVFSEAKRMQEEEDKLGEIYQSFSSPKYMELLPFIRKILTVRPNITDREHIIAAAEEMDECKTDGVDLSVANALRLTENRDDPMPIEALVQMLTDAGITDDNFLDVVNKGIESYNKELEELGQKKLDAGAAWQAVELERRARSLTDNNKDIVLMGVPNLDYDFAQVKLAFFTDEFTENEQKILYDMKFIADKTKFWEEHGIGYAIFYIEDVLK